MKKYITIFIISIYSTLCVGQNYSTNQYFDSKDNGIVRITLNDTITGGYDLYKDGKKIKDYVLSVETFENKTDLTKDIFDAINIYRKSKNIHELKFSIGCKKTSNDYSKFSSRDLFLQGHRPSRKNTMNESSFNRLSQRIEVYCGDDFQNTIENIITYTDDILLSSENIMNSWKGSPAHNKGMLSSKVNYGAVSVYRSVYTLKIKDKTYFLYKTSVVLNMITKN